jgi:hypothetical protein
MPPMASMSTFRAAQKPFPMLREWLFETVQP